MTQLLTHPPLAELNGSHEDLLARYREVRAFTASLCEGLAPEDQVVQSMPDVSPTKWHLAHTSWFFETFVVMPRLRDYRPIDPQYAFLFNSYYVHAGERHCRAQRGYISRPTVAEVWQYRDHVDHAVHQLVGAAPESELSELTRLIELGLHHEQQHQELMVTDIKHVFGVNPLRPAYRETAPSRGNDPGSVQWVEQPGGLVDIGHSGSGFSYDNEGPRHRVWLEPYALADRLVTNGDYAEFMEDGGYSRPELWLSLGWAHASEHQWTEPFYWERRDGRWWSYTLAGMREIDPREPVVHLSYFEADAFARWAGARLPTEFEWEAAAAGVPLDGNFVESERFHPASAPPSAGLRQMYGDVWQWTRSQYSPYPGYSPPPGALGEYNGKFMCNQFVLRGGSCATSATHIRATYRNFFPPDATWQFTGLRLAKDQR
ncbi:MAG TPA: ergothioneine biosynthesis protein EgtB [Longimicrobiales bacterium]